MKDSDILTAQDEAWLAAQEKATNLVHNSIELAHLESRLSRCLKEAEGIKAVLMELHEDEAVNCLEIAACALEDSKATLR